MRSPVLPPPSVFAPYINPVSLLPFSVCHPHILLSLKELLPTIIMKLIGIGLVLLVLLEAFFVLGDPNADPEAKAVADPNASPDPIARAYPSSSSSSFSSGGRDNGKKSI
ncbi:unnamed protein product [Darwinula stevensoni]|uniref:Uncharacterized protein n=1 Tax=Darwinula stevensoni TaxID=69355 RepID=A0A7R9ADS0_9CRUS|nr:unnamed protein product [Darwinula stevensoni]CAG0901349.1 unnamed protein product [Darwinula stevensoni]